MRRRRNLKIVLSGSEKDMKKDRFVAFFDAVMAIIGPIVECNRTQIDNGRTYLREMVFGNPEEPHHAEALTIVGQTEEAIAAVLRRGGQIGEAEAATRAHVVSAIMFLAMAATVNIARTVDEIRGEIKAQVAALLPH